MIFFQLTQKVTKDCLGVVPEFYNDCSFNYCITNHFFQNFFQVQGVLCLYSVLTKLLKGAYKSARYLFLEKNWQTMPFLEPVAC